MIKQRPLIGLAIDTTMSYGRAVLRGVLEYVNARREWWLHEHWRTDAAILEQWPHCAGIILAGHDSDVADLLRKKTRHLVVCSGAYDSDRQLVVCSNSKAVGQLAAQHLFKRGLKYFGYYGCKNSVSLTRAESFVHALKAAGFTVQISPIKVPTQHQWALRSHWPAAARWVRNLPKPVGILAFDDLAAHDLAALCLQYEIVVPEQVAIIGVNDDDLLCEGVWPPLTSVRIDFTQVGRLAARQLDRLLSGETLAASERHLEIEPSGITERLSTMAFAVHDPDVVRALTYIREHACDPCNVQQVLANIPTTRRSLERRFTKLLGQSLHQAIQRVRMDAARRLLLETDESMEKIADRCGFSEPQHFIRAFRQTQGTTPAAFRKLESNKNRG